MNNEKINIEDLFKDNFKDFKVEPSKNVWNKLKFKLWLQQFFNFGLSNFNVYYLTGIIVASVAGVTLITSRPDFVSDVSKDETIAKNESSSYESKLKSETYTEKTIQESRDSALINIDIKEKRSKTIITQDKETGTTKDKFIDDITLIQKTDSIYGERIIESSEGYPQDSLVNGFIEQVSDLAKQSDRIKSPIPIVEYATSINTGCAPLPVEFVNQSKNADSYEWSFGDGGTSTEENPSYIYDEPGLFVVILRTTGFDGEIYDKSNTIVVYESPDAIFEINTDMNMFPESPVFFYNYSKNGAWYEWDFGDNTTSTEIEPTHYYQEHGNYNVTLRVWSEHQCFDSLIIYNALTESEGEIIFPNAFTPNTEGPNYGYYTAGERSNDVFYPYHRGVVEYQLKIFNHRGVQIFESNDINIGWDGYYNERLAPQGVYIWKARGKYNNGKTFVKSGDVMLIIKKI